MRRTACTLLLACAAVAPALAGGFAREHAPALAVAARGGVRLPLDTPLRDAHGDPVRLGDFFQPGRPVLLVPGYWQCRTLCGTLMQGVLEAAADTGLPRSAYAIVGFSVDPEEGPADALARQRHDLDYAEAYGSRATPGGELPPPEFHLLLDRQGQGAALALRMGFDWRRAEGAGTDPADRWAHAAGFAVVSPQGYMVRSFAGVRFDPRALRQAIEAAAGTAPAGGWQGLVQGFALLCAHLDPAEGRHSATVMNAIRAGGVLLVLLLGFWMARHRRGGGA